MNTQESVQTKNTIIVAALYCCGKTHLYYNNDTKYSIIDLDEIINPKPKSVRKGYHHKYNDFNFVKAIKENIGKYDFIFVAIKQNLLKDLQGSKLPYVLVYPECSEVCKEEWRRRNKERNTMWLWLDTKGAFFLTMHQLKEDKHALCKYELKSNEYLSDIIDKIYNDCNS